MKKVLVNEQEIKDICIRIGNELTNKFKNNSKPPIFIGVLKGSMPFMMDLIKEVKCHIELDFVEYSSYVRTKSTGVVVMKKDLGVDIKKRDVVIIEDIVDTGRTLSKFQDYLKTYNPSSITTVVLLDKPAKRIANCEVDLIGKTIEDKFVIGYGLDYLELFRNTKEVYYIEPGDEELEEVEKMMGE